MVVVVVVVVVMVGWFAVAWRLRATLDMPTTTTRCSLVASRREDETLFYRVEETDADGNVVNASIVMRCQVSATSAHFSDLDEYYARLSRKVRRNLRTAELAAEAANAADAGRDDADGDGGDDADDNNGDDGAVARGVWAAG